LHQIYTNHGILHEVKVPKQLVDTIIVGEALAFVPKVDVIGKPDEWNFDTMVIAKYLLESSTEHNRMDNTNHHLRWNGVLILARCNH